MPLYKYVADRVLTAVENILLGIMLLERLAEMRALPGRQIGGESRFLKAGLEDWLRAPVAGSGKEAFLALAGVWRDDPDIEQIVRDALRRRGRTIVE